MKVCLRLFPMLLMSLSSVAAAQSSANRPNGVLPGELPVCQGFSSGTRITSGCEEDSSIVLNSEKEVTFTLKLDAPETLECKAEINLEYFQRDTVASVEARIENSTCAASSGAYDLEVRIRDDDGQSSVLEFSELWQRDDDLPVVSSKNYPIGENVDLVRLRTRGLSCTCAEPIEQQDAGSSEGISEAAIEE